MFWLSPLTFVLGYMLRNFMRPGGMAPSGAKGHIDNGFYFVYFLGQSGMASAACPIPLSCPHSPAARDAAARALTLPPPSHPPLPPVADPPPLRNLSPQVSSGCSPPFSVR